MADIKYNDATAQTLVINKDASLANGSRAAGNYDNGTALDTHADFFLVVQYDGGPPTAGDTVAILWVLSADDTGTPAYPQGGDGSVGVDVDPQTTLLAGVFETRSPSVTVDEILLLKAVPLGPRENRVVLKNTSGQTFDSTWELRMKPYKMQVI